MLTGFEVDRLHINTGCKVFVRTLAYIGYKGLSILHGCNLKSCTIHYGNQGLDVGKLLSDFPNDFHDLHDVKIL